MNNREITEAIDNGIKLSSLPTKDVEDKFLEVIKTLNYMGLDFSFFQNETILAKTIGAIKGKFGYLTDHELTIIINYGCQGEFKRQAQIVKGFHLFSWVGEYLEKRRQVLTDLRDTFDDDLNHVRYDVSNSPVGSAIVWKMNRVKLEDWEKIELQKIAEAIRREENMNKFAESYGIELINRI